MNSNVETQWIELIKTSGYFDLDYYCKENGVMNNENDAICHFLDNCVSLKLNPSKLFNVNDYLNKYEDVRENGINPLIHYLKFGKSEGRTIISVESEDEIDNYIELCKKSKYFDKEYYYSNNPDVKDSGISAELHYLMYGFKEGREPSVLFSGKYYYVNNPDVELAGMNPLVHYLLFGINENRKIRANISVDLVNRDKTNNSYKEIDMHGNKINLYPKPAYSLNDYNLDFCPSAPLLVFPYEKLNTKRLLSPNLGVHLHLYYEEYKEEFATYLKNIPFPYTLYISVADPKLIDDIDSYFNDKLSDVKIIVKYFENKGRDIAPLICGFGHDLLKHEFIAHFHSKRSPHNKSKADWRRQLMVDLIGSKSIVESVFSVFQNSSNVGMLFPEYHWSLKGQISWGTNFEASKLLADRIGLEIDINNLALFPAGSMFWARTSSLMPLFEIGLTYDDFPDENNQVDGTIAHGVERLFGELVYSTGYEVIQIRSNRPYNLTGYYPNKWPYEQRDLSEVVENYQKNKKKDNKIVVYTALTGGYDDAVIHEYLEPEFDYVIFTDEPIDNKGFWDVRPIDFWHPDKVRMARRIKTNPHVYLTDYDIAIWVDANVIIKGCIRKYIDILIGNKDNPIAGIPHPVRNCTYIEAQVLRKARKDTTGRVERQMQFYDAAGFPKNYGLIETNFMIVNLRHPKASMVYADWWGQLVKFSHRDQLGLNYSLWKNSADWSLLMDENLSLRDNIDFAYLGHGKNSGYRPTKLKRGLSEIIDPNNEKKDITLNKNIDIPIDVVVCVHNALDEVKVCLDSVFSSLRSYDSLIIVDDGSDADTEAFLKNVENQYANVTLIRNSGPANGYCKSANIGMASVKKDYFLLLNSDTILTHSALIEMLRVATSHPQIGIVGPLSNAASSQSIPDIKNTSTQTAVNILPNNVTVDEMNDNCKNWSCHLNPTVPLVHGFCQLISKKTYEKIGGFDQVSFPDGYGEENDFCFRAADAGFDLKIATRAYVFHSKSASYKDSEKRIKLMKAGNLKLKKLHTEDRLSQSVRMMEGNPVLENMRIKARNFFTKG